MTESEVLTGAEARARRAVIAKEREEKDKKKVESRARKAEKGNEIQARRSQIHYFDEPTHYLDEPTLLQVRESARFKGLFSASRPRLPMLLITKIMGHLAP